MARTGTLGEVVETRRVNAALSWLLVGFVCSVVIGSVVDDDLVLASVATSVVVLVLIPPASYRNATVMLPWEVIVLAVLPLFGRVFSTVALTSRLATYLSVAALALIVAVELHVFTAVRMTHWFAVLFVVIATMATAGVLSVVQWASDLYLGTAYIPDDRQLMWDFVAATAAGLGAGVIFDLYFRRFISAEVLLPDEVEEGVR